MPLKRHPALQDLSRDHQHFLIEARTIRWMVEGDPRALTPEGVRDSLLTFWEQQGALHLREEEEVLLPFCLSHAPEAGLQAELRHVLADHVWLRGQMGMLYAAGQEASPQTLIRLLTPISTHVVAHIRFEERELFERIQTTLSTERIAALGAHLISFRRQWRNADSVGRLGRCQDHRQTSSG